MLDISRAKLALHWMALADAILRCSLKLSLLSNCIPRYFRLLFHKTSSPPSAIHGGLKDLLSVTSSASVSSRAISRPLASSKRFTRHILSLILSSRIFTSSAAHTTSARPQADDRCTTNCPTRDPWGAPHVTSSSIVHVTPSWIPYLPLK